MPTDCSRELPTIAVIIPAVNEEAAIGDVIRAIPRDLVTEIIVVDGGSRDATVHLARRAGARVVTEPRRGFGRALATGVAATTSDLLAFIDGDGSEDASALPRIAMPIARGEADLVLGARTHAEPGALLGHQRLGNAIACSLISLRWHQRITDLPSFKAIRRHDLLALGLTEATYGWTVEMIVKAAQRGWRIREVPLTYRRRIGGESKVSGNAVASLGASVAILRVLVRHVVGAGAGRQVPLLSELDGEVGAE